MKKVLAIMLMLGLSSHALTQEVIEKTGDKCPSGYRDGKGHYCYPSAGDHAEQVVGKTNGQCPRGYRDGAGQYCYGRQATEKVIVKTGGDCPGGYRDGPGQYCYQ